MALVQSAGNASPALYKTKPLLKRVNSRGWRIRALRWRWGVRPMIRPPSFQVPQLGSNKLTRRTVLQINASDAVVLEK
jgi:hypothetical protein